MALTQSTMMALGTQAPAFSLPATSGATISLDDFTSAKALAVIFMCNHCPYVIHIAKALAKLAQDYQSQGVQFIGINSNDVNAYPADNFEHMKQEADNRGYCFPYLLDETQTVAKAYGAACTPDIYVFDQNKKLAYRGQFDETRPTRISSGNYNSEDSPATGQSLSNALDKILLGEAIPEETQTASMGCNIKWLPGNAPAYF